jgi:hypothetical protein
MDVLGPEILFAASNASLNERKLVEGLSRTIQRMLVRINLTSPGELPKRFAHAGDVFCIGALIRLRHGIRKLPSQLHIAPSK